MSNALTAPRTVPPSAALTVMIALCLALLLSLGACAPAATGTGSDTGDTSLTDAFPDSDRQDFPVWAGSLGAVEQAALTATRAYDPALSSSSLGALTPRSGLLIREIDGAGLDGRGLIVMLVEQSGRVVLGVFELTERQRVSRTPFALGLEKAIIAACDRLLTRASL